MILVRIQNIFIIHVALFVVVSSLYHSIMSESMQKCIPCSEMTPSSILSDDILNATMPFWKLNSSGQLSRVLVAKNFQAAMDFIVAVGAIAEKNGHHPDIHLTSYRNVEIILYTHSVNGVTEADVQLAVQLDEVEVQYSPKWLQENPNITPK